MNGRTGVLVVTMLLASVTSACTVTRADGAPDSDLTWGPCEAALSAAAGVDGPASAEQLRCTQLAVPLDYARPESGTIDIAISRISAQSEHRRGTLFVNPGGPGLEGRSLPLLLSDLSDWDVVGIDVRGTGASTGPSCSALDMLEPPSPDPGESDVALEAQAYVSEITTANLACDRSDGPLIKSLTAANAARDMDRIREHLGIEKVSYFGVSWGTELGLTYRTLFPDHVESMVLDSPVYLGTSMDEQNSDLAAAIDRYSHFGASSTGDSSTTPTQSSGVPEAKGHLPHIAEKGSLLKLMTRTARSAYICNSLDAAPGPAEQWTNHVRIARHAGLPLADRIPHPANSELPGASMCSGWPTPGQGRVVADTHSPLLMVGHRYETTTPYAWAHAAVREAGGTLVTVEDGNHGSAMSGPCAVHLIAFLDHAAPPPPTCGSAGR